MRKNLIMTDRQITHIKKPNRLSPFDRIDEVGNANTLLGGGWRMTVDEVLYALRLGHTFWVNSGGYRVEVIRVVGPWGNDYIKTDPDGRFDNNLLSLPELP
jgi:hypothetical protein